MPTSTPPDDDDPDLTSALEDAARLYEGRVVRIPSGRGRGLVKTAAGAELPFDFATVAVGGAIRSLRALRAGTRVTFDVSATRDGPQITHLWVGAAPARRRDASD